MSLSVFQICSSTYAQAANRRKRGKARYAPFCSHRGASDGSEEWHDMPPLWSKSTSSSIGRQRRESSAPLREVAPRPTLHRPSLCRAQIQVRAISEEDLIFFSFFAKSVINQRLCLAPNIGLEAAAISTLTRPVASSTAFSHKQKPHSAQSRGRNYSRWIVFARSLPLLFLPSFGYAVLAGRGFDLPGVICSLFRGRACVHAERRWEDLLDTLR